MTRSLKIPARLAKRLERYAVSARRKPQVLLESMLEEKLGYEEWLLKKIDKGLADIEAGRTVTTEEMLAGLERRKAERAGKAKKAA